MSGVGRIVVAAAEVMRQTEEAAERIAEAYDAAELRSPDSLIVEVD